MEQVLIVVLIAAIAAFILSALAKTASEVSRIIMERGHLKKRREDRKARKQPSGAPVWSDRPPTPEKTPEKTPERVIKNLNQIPDDRTGRLLMMAIAIITTESRREQTPYEVLDELNVKANQVYREN